MALPRSAPRRLGLAPGHLVCDQVPWISPRRALSRDFPGLRSHLATVARSSRLPWDTVWTKRFRIGASHVPNGSRSAPQSPWSSDLVAKWPANLIRRDRGAPLLPRARNRWPAAADRAGGNRPPQHRGLRSYASSIAENTPNARSHNHAGSSARDAATHQRRWCPRKGQELQDAQTGRRCCGPSCVCSDGSGPFNPSTQGSSKQVNAYWTSGWISFTPPKWISFTPPRAELARPTSRFDAGSNW